MQSINSTSSFQSSTKYSLFGPGYENPTRKTEGEPNATADDQEGIYEVLDGDENKPTTKGVASKDGRQMLLSEEESGLYNKLKFEDPS